MKLKEIIKCLKNYNDIDVPDKFIDPLFKYLVVEDGYPSLIDKEDIDYIFENADIDWEKTVKYLSFSISNPTNKPSVKVYVDFLDNNADKIQMKNAYSKFSFLEKDIYEDNISELIDNLIPDSYDILGDNGGQLLIKCFDKALLDFFDKNGIKLVQGHACHDRGITFLDSIKQLYVEDYVY